MNLAALAKLLGGTLHGDGECEVCGIAQVDDVRPDEITFIDDPRYLERLGDRTPVAVLVREVLPALDAPQIVVADPRLAAVQAAMALVPEPPVKPGVDARAVVDPSARVDASAAVMALAYVGPGAVVGPQSVLMPHSYVGPEAVVGGGCVLHPGANVGARCRLGDRVILHQNVSVGADGFGYVRQGDVHVKVPQRGIVVIEDDVEIGANSCVDRATFGRTVVGAGTKIDNLVQIAHNCLVGRRVLFVAQTGLAGSVVVGDDVVLAGRAAVAPHVRIGAGAILGGGAGAIRDVPAGQMVAGIPAVDHMTWKREVVALAKLPQALKDLNRLRKRVEGKERD